MRKTEKIEKDSKDKMATSEAEWREKLSPEQFHVTREHGTERAFSHPYYKEKREGMYRCVCCGEPPVQLRRQVRLRYRMAELLCAGNEDSVSAREDRSLFMRRTRGPLRQMRGASWSCVSRRARPPARAIASMALRSTSRQRGQEQA